MEGRGPALAMSPLSASRESGMALPSQSILRSGLLALLGARIAVSQDEACTHLAQRLGTDRADSAIDSDDPLFRGEVRNAAHDLVEDGLVELKPGPSCLQWRIVQRLDAGERIP